MVGFLVLENSVMTIIVSHSEFIHVRTFGYLVLDLFDLGMYVVYSEVSC